jgi:hypothetical protein
VAAACSRHAQAQNAGEDVGKREEWRNDKNECALSPKALKKGAKKRLRWRKTWMGGCRGRKDLGEGAVVR